MDGTGKDLVIKQQRFPAKSASGIGVALKFVPWRVQGQRLSFSMTVPSLRRRKTSSFLCGEAGGLPSGGWMVITSGGL